VGVEPTTLALGKLRSVQLSYGGIVLRARLELATIPYEGTVMTGFTISAFGLGEQSFGYSTRSCI
jgi:hypothetical protein